MQNLFIIGSPRSGTTFLASLLEKSKYKAPYETQFILKYYEKLSTYGDLDQFDNFSNLVSDILKERAVVQWQCNINLQDMFERLSKPVQYVDLVDYICSYLVNKNPDSDWGDKTPHYILKLPKLIDLYPNAKYIYLIRDGRDVALSLLRKPWGPNNIHAAAKDWKQANGEDNQLMLQALEDNGQLLTVRYEKLVDDYSEEIKRVLGFLGEPLEDHQKFIEQQEKNLMNGNFYKWKKEMSSRQIRDYAGLAGHELVKHGYEVEQSHLKPLSFVREKFYQVHNLFFHAYHLFEMNVIDGFKIKFLNKQPFAD